MFFGSIRQRNAVAKILSAPGGEYLSSETANFCAQILLMEPRPYYRGDKAERREFPRNSLEGIAKSVSHCHSVNQGLQREFNLKLRNAVVMAAIGWIPGLAAIVYELLK